MKRKARARMERQAARAAAMSLSGAPVGVTPEPKSLPLSAQVRPADAPDRRVYDVEYAPVHVGAHQADMATRRPAKRYPDAGNMSTATPFTRPDAIAS